MSPKAAFIFGALQATVAALYAFAVSGMAHWWFAAAHAVIALGWAAFGVAILRDQR